MFKVLNQSKLFFHTSILLAFSFIAFPWFLLFTDEVNLLRGNLAPNFNHFFGTDSLGRDLLLRISLCIYTNLIPVLLIVGLSHLSSMILFTFLINRKSASLIIRFCSKISAIFYSFPLPILVLLGARVLNLHSVSTIWLVFFIFFFAKTWLLLQSAYTLDMNKTYWKNYLLTGGRRTELVIQYGIFDGWLKMLIYSFCNHFQQGIIIEAIFSYLGFGMVEPLPSFGNMISAHFEQIFSTSGTALLIITLCLYVCLSVPKSLLYLGSLCKVIKVIFGNTAA